MEGSDDGDKISLTQSRVLIGMEASRVGRYRPGRVLLRRRQDYVMRQKCRVIRKEHRAVTFDGRCGHDSIRLRPVLFTIKSS